MDNGVISCSDLRDPEVLGRILAQATEILVREYGAIAGREVIFERRGHVLDGGCPMSIDSL